jgi:hypothetical protein
VVDKIYRLVAKPIPSEFCLDMVTVFCDLDDFCRSLLSTKYPQLPGRSAPSPIRANRLSLSEIMTILVWLHASHYRTCKHFYLGSVLPGHRAEFPVCPATPVLSS